MNIQKINPSKINFFNFKAGKINLYSDFDGTYMPQKYSHDSICNKSPEVNKKEFQTHFKKLYELFNKIKGNADESKLNFVLTTGRNIHEQNYYFDKIKEQGLRVPLPNSIITCNGQDEFYLNVQNEKEYYNNPGIQAFSKNNVNKEKREYYKGRGWDYERVKLTLKGLLKEKQFNIEKPFINGKEKKLKEHIKSFLNINNNDCFLLFKELQASNLTEKDVRAILEKYSKVKHKTEQEIKDYEWHMGQLGKLVFDELNSKITIIDSVPTTRSNKEYGNGLSLQHKMKKQGLSHNDEIYAFSDDGELGIRVAVNSNYKNNLIERNDGNKKKLKIFYGTNLNNIEISKLKNSSYLGNEFEVRPPFMDKFNDTKALLDKIIKEKTNDLLIVSGDGSNDLQMLSIAQYIGNNPDPSCINTLKNVELLKNIPLISIYVDNRSEEEKKDLSSKKSHLVNNGDYFNFDGNIRFIHVDPSNPNKPHTLEEATNLAIYSYAQRNEEFKNNLSPEMQTMVNNYKMTYPINQEIAKKGQKIYSEEYITNNEFNDSFSSIALQYEKLESFEDKYGINDIEIEACNEDCDIELKDRLKILASLLIIITNKNKLYEVVTEEKIQDFLYQKYQSSKNKESKPLRKTIAVINNEINYIKETELISLKNKISKTRDKEPSPTEVSPTKTKDKRNTGAITTDSSKQNSKQNTSERKTPNTTTPKTNNTPKNQTLKDKLKRVITKTKKWIKKHKLTIALVALITTSITSIAIKNKMDKNTQLKIHKKTRKDKKC